METTSRTRVLYLCTVSCVMVNYWAPSNINSVGRSNVHGTEQIILFLSLISLPVCREPPLGLYQSNNIALDNLGLWALHWRHNDHDGVSNHQPHGFLLNRLFRRRSKNTQALRHWPLCGEFTGSGEFPTQRASYAENVSIWWRHHGDDLPREINVDLWYSILIVDFMESRWYHSGRMSYTCRSENMSTLFCLNGSKTIALWKYEILHHLHNFSSPYLLWKECQLSMILYVSNIKVLAKLIQICSCSTFSRVTSRFVVKYSIADRVTATNFRFICYHCDPRYSTCGWNKSIFRWLVAKAFVLYHTIDNHVVLDATCPQ